MTISPQSTREPCVRMNVPMAELSTFRLGGVCRRLVECEAPEELAAAIEGCGAAGEPWLLFGGGSNVLVSDAGYEGTVIRYLSEAPRIKAEGAEWVVAGSTVLDDLARAAAEQGFAGLECCNGIPGTVGGAIAGNAGAWGRQISEPLTSVDLIDAQGRQRTAQAGDLDFAYRSSSLQRSGEAVLSARFRLVPAPADELLAERARILETRAAKHPDWHAEPCIGSFFRNIEPSSSAERRQAAGWFLEQAGAKEMRVGGAYVYPKHANIIVKGPGCTAQDVRDLAQAMQDAVRAAFGLALQREVRYLGRFNGEEDQPADRFF